MLSTLIERANVPKVVTGPDVAVSGFAIDHRKVAKGMVFGAFPGAVANGEDYIPAAVAAGAVAVVARPEAKVTGAAHVAARNPRAVFARLAARFFSPVPGCIVAVTGTNGKTSCAEFTRQLWQMLGYRAASIGTLGVTMDGHVRPTGLTSPDIVTFLSSMADLAEKGCTHAVYEASSHGLVQHRCEGLPVAAGAFTNLARDHLDFHVTIDAYFAAKMRLFDEVVSKDGVAVIWADDPWSDKVAIHAGQRGLRVFSIGFKGQDLTLVSSRPCDNGQILQISYAGKTHDLTLPLLGGYQAANALVAAGLVIATGGDAEVVFHGLTQLKPVRGRLEYAGAAPAGALIYVDFAHTADGLTAALAALRPHTSGRLAVVFGAGGDRDKGKRATMGRAACAGADLVIVTDDNPRGEDPAEIRRMVMAGAANTSEVYEVADRREAIEAALHKTGRGDIVLIAGKGHEQGQIIGSGANRRILPFDDVVVVQESIAKLGGLH